jgi:hypothetical protein
MGLCTTISWLDEKEAREPLRTKSIFAPIVFALTKNQPLEKLPSEILYIILQHMINEDYESIQALKTPKYSGMKICHRCRSPWDSLYGLLPNIFYAAPQLLAFSQLSKFTRELVINEAKINPKIKEIMTVSHSVIKNHNLTFNRRHKLGDGMWLCEICIHAENWDKARMFRDWLDGWENWMKSEELWS